MTSPTTPRDAIGLSERLQRALAKAGPEWAYSPLVKEAATQLDALSAERDMLRIRVEELEAERDQMAEVLASPLADKVIEYADRATRAEQERDELELLARGQDTPAFIAWETQKNRAEKAEQERDEALEALDRLSSFQISKTLERTGKLSDLYKDWIEHKRAARDCVRRLASGPDKEKRE